MTSREALDFCELDISFCQLQYGVSPCAAELGVTGEIKCFNTRGTCQDPENLDLGTVTLRFGKDTGYIPRSIECIPSLLSVDYSPATLSLGKSLGERASVTFVFKDHGWGDTGEGYDKYRTERPYDPAKQGTFWGKLRARHVSLRGRPIRWKTGFLGQSLAQMQTRHFIVDSIDGPRRDGTFAIIAKDVLKLADGDRAQTPPLTNGALQSDIADDAMSFTAVFPAGYDASQYPTSEHYVCIGGNEIVRVTRSGSTFTVQTGGRAEFGTEAVAHNAGDRIQLCRYYDAKTPSEILSDVFINDCGVDPSYIPLSEWELEEDTYLQRLYTSLIPEPVASRKFVDSIIEVAGLSVWSDELAPAVRMQILRGIPSNAVTFAPDTNILKDSFSVRDQPDTRISRSITRFAIRNPLLRESEPQSFRSVHVLNDADSELLFGSPAIREINASCIPPFGDTTAERTNALQIGRFATPPRRFNFKVSRTGDLVPVMGMGARLRWPHIIQDVTGLDTDTPIQITRVKPGGEAFEVEAEEMLVKLFDPQDITNRSILINTNSYNLNLLAVHNSLYPPLTDADVLAGVTLTAIIAPNIVLGSTSIASFSLTIPEDWPDGLEITLNVLGHLSGKGGDGASYSSPTTAIPAQDGGPALFTRFPIKLIGSGAIQGGGGGGGKGGNGGSFISALKPGPPGGGGAGWDPGIGGVHPFLESANGSPGTLSEGGEGGNRPSGSNGLAGTGGGPGQAGQNGTDGTDGPGSPGGAAGIAIDGWSYVTDESTVTIHGPTIN